MAKSPKADVRSRDSAEHHKGRLHVFGWKTAYAAAQLVALGMLLALHTGLERLEHWLSPDAGGYGFKLVEGVLNAAVVLVSLHLIFDMVVLFVPWLRKNEKWNLE